MPSFNEFLQWEKASKDTLDFKKTYVDMAGDLVSGLLLSQIVYWHLPHKKKGDSRLRVFRDGHWWIAKEQDEWWDEIGLSARQVERAMSILEGLGLIIKKNYLFNNKRTNHVRINHEKFMESWQKALEGGGPVSTKGGSLDPALERANRD